MTLSVPASLLGALGGAARCVDMDFVSTQVLTSNETTTGLQQQAISRYGDFVGSINGSNPVANGAGGGAGSQAGLKYFRGWRAQWIGPKGALVGDTPRDYYWIYAPAIITERPALIFRHPMAAWQVTILMALGPLGAAITRDVGVLFLSDTSVTGYPAGMRSSTAQTGIGLVYTGANGAVNWIARKAVGAALSEDIQIAQPGLSEWARFDVRFVSATPVSDAAIKVFYNGTLVLTRLWGAGTVLPNRTDIPTWLGGFRPFYRNDELNATGANIYCSHLRIQAAETEDALNA